MALVTQLERPEDIDIPKAYSRISSFYVRRSIGASGTTTFTIIEYDTYQSANTRADNPDKPIKVRERIKVEDWTPTGATAEKVMESVYNKLADELGIPNVKV